MRVRAIKVNFRDVSINWGYFYISFAEFQKWKEGVRGWEDVQTGRVFLKPPVAKQLCSEILFNSFLTMDGAVYRAAECSPCPCHEGRWRHLSAGSLSSHTGWPTYPWWVGHYVWGPGRHCHQAGRRSSNPPPPLDDSHLHHPAPESGDSTCHSTSEERKELKWKI